MEVAAILAGGLGTRLRPAMSDKPKVLAEVAGRPFLGYLLDHLADSGICRVVLCTGHLGGAIPAQYGAEYRGMSLLYSRETEPLGTGGALRQALPLLDRSPVLVMNGDSWCPADFTVLGARHVATEALATLLLTRVSDGARYGSVEMAPDGRITSFIEKDEAAGPSTINAGAYLLDGRVIRGIPDEGFVSLEREILPTYLGTGLWGHVSSAPFIDIGTPASLAQAQDMLAAEVR